MFKLLSDFKPKSVPILSKNTSFSSSSNSSSDLKWDSTKCGTGIAFESNKSLVYLK